MKKILVFSTTALLLFNSSVLAVTKGSDEVNINTPSENAEISGTYEVKWLMKDDEVDDPGFFMDVYNLSCSQNGGNIGRVTNSGEQKDGDNYTYSWDTTKGTTGTALRDSANYCLRVCGIMADGASVYSLCDKKSFVYSKTQSGDNQIPEITDSQTTFNTTLDEEFTHQVIASDPDGDELTFSFQNNNPFLEINKTTGEITGTPTEVGTTKFIVKVDDGKGGVDTQEYTLKVGTSISGELVITSPTADTVISSTNSQISWTVDDSINVTSVVLSFSQDQNEWTEIARLDRNTGSYEWDVSGVASSDYFLRIQVTDENNQLYETVSDQFTVDSVVVDSTQIIIVSPTEGQELDNTSGLTIAADFVTPENVTIDPEDVIFKLDEREDLTVCDKSATGISCDVVGQLASGAHNISITLVDSTGATQIKEWNFSVVSTEQSALSANTIQLILIIFAVGFVLIALPWALYMFYKRRKDKKESMSSTPIQPQGDGVPENINLPGNTSSKEITQQEAATEQSPMTSNESENINIETQSVPVIPPVVQLPVDTDISLPENNIKASNVDSAKEIQQSIAQDVNVNKTENSTNPVGTNELVEPPTVEPPQTITPEDAQTSTSVITPAETQIPGMYNQESIPEWMQSQNDNSASSSQPNMGGSNSSSKVDVAEGARVYDPYGLALNPDENTDNNNQ